ncbi:MAG: methyltransferase domain-containing protein [Planctomyces sp.]|nr:methyltransferase domain-containing protein [Planctomyces sp.]
MAHGHVLPFLSTFLQHPRELGTFLPSSRHLEARLVRNAAVETAATVVELGPGTGGTTQALLRAMPEDSRLVAIEVCPKLTRVLREIDDPRLIVHQGGADELHDVLDDLSIESVDAVVSGIPFSTIPRTTARLILRASRSRLKPGGRFVAYQWSRAVTRLAKEFFGTPTSEFELRNFPPLRVYRWTKSAIPASGGTVLGIKGSASGRFKATETRRD